MKNKRFLAHGRKLKDILKKYVACAALLLLASLCVGVYVHAPKIEANVQEAMETALIEGLQWGTTGIACISVFFIGWSFFYLDGVECTETSINYYKWIFSRRAKEIAYEEISDCVFSDGTWRYKKQNLTGVTTRFFKDEEEILSVNSNPEFCVQLFHALGEKVKIVDHDRECVSLDRYFKTDFKRLMVEEKWKCLQCYCDWYRTEYKTAEEILRGEGRT